MNQISMKPEAAKSGGISGLLKSKILWLIVGSIGLFILFAILGSVLTPKKSSVKDDVVWLQLHLGSTSKVISEYQPKVKSSILRSSSASLSTVLASTNSKLTDYIAEKYKDKKDKDKDKQLNAKIASQQESLETELFEAKITGALDRVYAHKMAYEISIFLAEEAKIRKESKDDVLNAIIDESYSSLENLYANFDSFSEGS